MIEEPKTNSFRHDLIQAELKSLTSIPEKTVPDAFSDLDYCPFFN